MPTAGDDVVVEESLEVQTRILRRSRRRPARDAVHDDASAWSSAFLRPADVGSGVHVPLQSKAGLGEPTAQITGDGSWIVPFSMTRSPRIATIMYKHMTLNETCNKKKKKQNKKNIANCYDDGFRALENLLMKNPEAVVILFQMLAVLCKMRFRDARRGKGKRGGLRVIYYWWNSGFEFWLFMLYDKDELAESTPKQRGELGHDQNGIGRRRKI